MKKYYKIKKKILVVFFFGLVIISTSGRNQDVCAALPGERMLGEREEPHFGFTDPLWIGAKYYRTRMLQGYLDRSSSRYGDLRWNVKGIDPVNHWGRTSKDWGFGTRQRGRVLFHPTNVEGRRIPAGEYGGYDAGNNYRSVSNEMNTGTFTYWSRS